jgi:hypothetical protein
VALDLDAEAEAVAAFLAPLLADLADAVDALADSLALPPLDLD